MRFFLKDVNLSITNVNDHHPGHTPSCQEIILTKLFLSAASLLQLTDTTWHNKNRVTTIATLSVDNNEISFLNVRFDHNDTLHNIDW